MNEEEKKQVIVNILTNKFNTVYCDSCDGENCDDCNRKQMNWGLSETYARYIAKNILDAITK